MSETTEGGPFNQLRDQYQWRKVSSPVIWRPEKIGDELVGFYGGVSLLDGPHGEYEVVVVHIPLDRSYMISGARIVQLLPPALIPMGHPVRIVWQGMQKTGSGVHSMKTFDVMVAEGPAVPGGD